jgi:hypothetical protein
MRLLLVSSTLGLLGYCAFLLDLRTSSKSSFYGLSLTLIQETHTWCHHKHNVVTLSNFEKLFLGIPGGVMSSSKFEASFFRYPSWMFKVQDCCGFPHTPKTNSSSQILKKENNKQLITQCLCPRVYGYCLACVMVLQNIFWQFECKIYWLVVSPICFNNSWDTLLDGCVCSYIIKMGTINCYDFFKLKFHWVLVHKNFKFIWLCWVGQTCQCWNHPLL